MITRDNSGNPMLRPKDLARRWAMSHRSLARWRTRGFGPAFVRIGGAVRYPLAEIERFEQARRQPSPAETVSNSVSRD